jgi:hypothetical protein
MPTEITPADLIESATAPQSVTTDGVSVTERSVLEQIEADKYAAGKAALAGTNKNGGPKSGWRALRAGRVVPPGAQ